MTFDAKWYNLLHTGFKTDVPYYVSAVAGADSVLELGCGSGRITLPIAKSGVSITGVDNSFSMLSFFEERMAKLEPEHRARIETVLSDMRGVRLCLCFDKVIIPYNGLLCLLDDDAVIECFRTVAKHLAPRGELIFDIYDVPEDFEAADEYDEDDGSDRDSDGGPAFEFLTTIYDKDRAVQVFERSLPHPDSMRFDTEYRYRYVDDNGDSSILTQYAIKQRGLYKEDLPRLLAAADLEIVSITGDFLDVPLTDDTEQLVIRARAASKSTAS